MANFLSKFFAKRQKTDKIPAELKEINNPYVAGRRQWLEFYGDTINLNQKLIIGIGVSILITLIAVIGLVYSNSQSKFIPYIVEIDKLGSPVYAGIPQKIQAIDAKVIKYTLAEFISNIRSVYADQLVQEQLVVKAYNHLEPNSQAHTEITSVFRADNPIKRVQNERVLINILNVSPISQDTWQVDWQERVTDIKGMPRTSLTYRGILTITVRPPIEDKDIFVNPAGIWITNFSYSTITR